MAACLRWLLAGVGNLGSTRLVMLCWGQVMSRPVQLGSTRHCESVVTIVSRRRPIGWPWSVDGYKGITIEAIGIRMAAGRSRCNQLLQVSERPSSRQQQTGSYLSLRSAADSCHAVTVCDGAHNCQSSGRSTVRAQSRIHGCTPPSHWLAASCRCSSRGSMMLPSCGAQQTVGQPLSLQRPAGRSI